MTDTCTIVRWSKRRSLKLATRGDSFSWKRIRMKLLFSCLLQHDTFMMNRIYWLLWHFQFTANIARICKWTWRKPTPFKKVLSFISYFGTCWAITLLSPTGIQTFLSFELLKCIHMHLLQKKVRFYVHLVKSEADWDWSQLPQCLAWELTALIHVSEESFIKELPVVLNSTYKNSKSRTWWMGKTTLTADKNAVWTLTLMTVQLLCWLWYVLVFLFVS